MIKKFLKDQSNLTDDDFNELAEGTKGFNGSDIRNFVSEAAM